MYPAMLADATALLTEEDMQEALLCKEPRRISPLLFFFEKAISTLLAAYVDLKASKRVGVER